MSDLHQPQFGMTEAAALGLTYPKLLRTQLERKAIMCGVRHPAPLSRWTFSIADVLFLRILNYVSGLGPGFDPSRVAPLAMALAGNAGQVWEGTAANDLKVALGFETRLSPHHSAVVDENFSTAWATGSDKWCRMQIVVPVGAIVAEVRAAMDEKAQKAERPASET